MEFVYSQRLRLTQKCSSSRKLVAVIVTIPLKSLHEVTNVVCYPL